jgi:hypothetical protein
MHTLPPAIILLLLPFAPLFSKRVWPHVQVLLAGAILAPAQRTVTAALRGVGLGQTPHFQRYHRVLNRASWSKPSLYVRVSRKRADSKPSCAVTLAYELSPSSSQAPGGRLNGSVWSSPYRHVASCVPTIPTIEAGGRRGHRCRHP